MRDNLNRHLARVRRTFTGFTTGQKVVAVVGTGALLVAAFLVFRWVSAPSYAPLYSNLSGADASAVIDELEAQGVPYEITGDGGTVMVPRSDVYTTRIALSGKGLPAATDSGYSLLDSQDLSTSEFKEQTDFKRAMEGELATTIEAIDGVDTAVVHLALPEKEVFSDEQDPATASVLLDTSPGTTVGPEQVQAVTHLVASSIGGLDPKKVTVADATGTVLTTPESEGGVAAASTRTQQVTEFQEGMRTEIQKVLDRVVGPGNSTTNVTADLDFDASVTDTTTYHAEEDLPPLAEAESSETYTGPAGGADGVGGVVGPDGQMDPVPGATGESSYENTDVTRDNAVGETKEHRETAPGAVNSLHIGVVLDATAAAAIEPTQVQELIAAAVGIDRKRGDTIEVTTMPFDRTTEEAAAAEVAAAAAAEKREKEMALYRNLALGGTIALVVLLVLWQARRRAAARHQAATYVVEQLRAEAAARTAAVDPAPALAALEAAEADEQDSLQDELAALVEKQPEDVAALLRGWLVEPR